MRADEIAKMSGQKTYDVAVVGAGVFGAWTAWHLAKRGKRVVLIEAYGPGHSRASSGGETRIIRMGYGADELYTRWSQRSLVQWREFSAAAKQPLFLETSVLRNSGCFAAAENSLHCTSDKTAAISRNQRFVDGREERHTAERN